jgi:hypothetical protein
MDTAMGWVDVHKVLEADPPADDEVEQVLEFTSRHAKPWFYADENFPAPALALLRNKGARVVTAQDAGLSGHADEDPGQLDRKCETPQRHNVSNAVSYLERHDSGVGRRC